MSNFVRRFADYFRRLSLNLYAGILQGSDVADSFTALGAQMMASATRDIALGGAAASFSALGAQSRAATECYGAMSLNVDMAHGFASDTKRMKVEPPPPPTRFPAGSLKEAAATVAQERSFSACGNTQARAGFDALETAAHGESSDCSDEEYPLPDAPPIGRGLWPWETGYKPERGLGGARLHRPVRSTDALREKALDMASARGDRGKSLTGTKRWREYCESIGESPDRPIDDNCPLWVRLEEETLIMDFVCWLVEVKGLKPDTARAYFGHAQFWHRGKWKVKFAGNLKLENLPMMMKGLRRLFVGPEQKIRRGIAPHMLRAAMDRCLDPSNPAHANMRAALSLALQGLLRSAEFTVKRGSDWKTATHLARSDIKRLDKVMLVLMMHPCKNMHHQAGKTCPLVIGAGAEFIDAAAEIRNMLEVDPGRGANTPLFRDPRTGAALQYDAVLAAIKTLMHAIGETSEEFGTHSLRIGGATALFAAGADATVIRTMGRWSSDLYRLYVRASFEQTIAWSIKCGSTTVHDVAGVRDFDEVDYY